MTGRKKEDAIGKELEKVGTDKCRLELNLRAVRVNNRTLNSGVVQESVPKAANK